MGISDPEVACGGRGSFFETQKNMVIYECDNCGEKSIATDMVKLFHPLREIAIPYPPDQKFYFLKEPNKEYIICACSKECIKTLEESDDNSDKNIDKGLN